MTESEEPKKKVLHEVKIYGTGSNYIDPVHCDSTVSYKVVGQRSYLESSVTLSDCSHKIEWYFANRKDSIEKIDIAINMLSNFKKVFVKARKDYPVTKEEEAEQY